MPLQLTAVLASFYCLSLSSLLRQCEAQSRDGRVRSSQWPVPIVLPAFPAEISARAPASPQFKHNPNSQVKPAHVFLGNSFLHDLDLGHFFPAVVQLTGRAPMLGCWGSRAFHALPLHDPFAKQMPLQCQPGPVPATCAWRSFPWGRVSPCV